MANMIGALGRAGDPDLARLGNPAEHVSLSRLGVTGTEPYGVSVS